MKVLLINAPCENKIIANNPPVIEEERGINPPLGLLYIAGYLERHANHDIKIIDSQVDGLSYPELKSKIEELKPDVVGVTAMTLTLVDVVKTINLVKELDKNIQVVLGGPHVFLFPEETINLGNVDYAVLGEGEESFKGLLDYLGDKRKLREVPGLVFKDNGGIVNTGFRPLIKDLDGIPFPARHLTPYKKYYSILAKRSPVTTIFTSRGCPFQCSFCARPHLGKRFRTQSAKRVVDELEECTKMGICEFLFYDDTFTVDRKRVIDICNEIVKRKLDIGWDMRSRVDTVDEEVIRHLKMAGCQGIHYGVEAGTEKILKVLNKGITLDQVKKTFNFTKRYRIPILAYYMVGNPTETKEDIYETFRVMRMLNSDYAHITIFTPFPGTDIYLDGLRKGVFKKDYWREFSKNPTPDFVAPHWDEVFTREELNVLLVKGYKSFYMRPLYALKKTMAIRSFSEFKRKITAGLKVAFMKQGRGVND